jgi:CubicO group peptidase (beta-lactamase class C family)
MVIALAHSRGWLDFDRRVSNYWPEFAHKGKADMTVRQLLAHQAGLCALDAPVDRQPVDRPTTLLPEWLVIKTFGDEESI